MMNLSKNINLLAALIGSIGSIIALFFLYRTTFDINLVQLVPLVATLVAVMATFTYFLSSKLKERERTIFIIYAQSDKEKAELIRQELTKYGLNAIMDDQVIRIGDNIKETLERHITAANKILILLSNASANSEWIEREIEVAKKANKLIYPAKLSESALPKSLEGIKYAELFELNKESVSPLIKALRN